MPLGIPTPIRSKMEPATVSSSFDRDFGRSFDPVEQTVVIDEGALKLLDRRPPGDPELAKRHRLWVIEPSGQEWEYPIDGEILIGRAEDNQIVVDDRAVSRHHLAINTDQKLYWFRDLESGNGTQLNGEYTSEGWLTGGEKITVGNTEIYFMPPEIAPPDEFDVKEKEFEEAAAAAAAAAAAGTEGEVEEGEGEGEEGATAAPTPSSGGGSRVPILIFLMLLGLSVSGVAVWFVARSLKKPPPSREIAPKGPSQLQQALALFNRGETLIKKGEWKEADRTLRKAATMIPPDNAFRNVILAAAKKADFELKAQQAYNKARDLYLKDESKGLNVLKMLTKIPKDTKALESAEQLRKRIIRPMLKEARNQATLGKFEEARALLTKLRGYAPPKHPMLEKLKQDIDDAEAEKNKKKGRYRPRRRRRPSQELQGGLSKYKRGEYSSAIVFFRRKEASGSGSVRKWARRYRKHVQVFQRTYALGYSAYRSGNTSRAISLLKQAYRADKSLGKGRRRSVSKVLAQAYNRKGRSALRSRNHMTAASYFRRALSYDRYNSSARSGLGKMRGVAKKLYNEAKVIKDVDSNEARKLFRKVMRLLPSSDPLYRSAKQQMN